MALKIVKKSLKKAFFGDPCGTRTRVTAVKGRCLNRLTNGPNEFRQLSTFPGGRPPSIIDVKELNFRVRDGNGWILLAIVTGSSSLFEVVPSKLNNVPLFDSFSLTLFLNSIGQALGLLVPVS